MISIVSILSLVLCPLLSETTDESEPNLVRFYDVEAIASIDMDENIGEAVRKVGPQKGDPWAQYDSLQKTPMVVLWGVMSDILTEDIIDKMKARKADLEVVPIPNRGHVPLLDEPECLAAIDAFIGRVA